MRGVSLVLAMSLLVSCASPSADDHGERIPALAFSELDANGDGSLDSAEFHKLADAIFARLDANGDEQLSPAEYKKLFERPHHRGHREGGRSRGGWPEGGMP